MITAQYHSECASCADPIIPGQQIERGDDGWRHQDCDRPTVERVECVCSNCFLVHAANQRECA